MISEDQ